MSKVVTVGTDAVNLIAEIGAKGRKSLVVVPRSNVCVVSEDGSYDNTLYLTVGPTGDINALEVTTTASSLWVVGSGPGQQVAVFWVAD